MGENIFEGIKYACCMWNLGILYTMQVAMCAHN